MATVDKQPKEFDEIKRIRRGGSGYYPMLDKKDATQISRVPSSECLRVVQLGFAYLVTAG